MLSLSQPIRGSCDSTRTLGQCLVQESICIYMGQAMDSKQHPLPQVLGLTSPQPPPLCLSVETATLDRGRLATCQVRVRESLNVTM